MNLPESIRSKSGNGQIWRPLVAMIVLVAPVSGQRFDITPLIGLRTGGSVDVQQEGAAPRGRAYLGESLAYGIAAGFRYNGEDGCDGCAVIEFRWMRQKTNLGFSKDTTAVPTPLLTLFPRTSVTFDHYLGDFSYELQLDEAKSLRPYVIASMGASHMSTAIGGKTGFTFGIGGGLKVFPHRNWGIRFQAEYLPTVLHGEVQRLFCAGGCAIVVRGSLLNQFEFNVGPVFRF